MSEEGREMERVGMGKQELKPEIVKLAKGWYERKVYEIVGGCKDTGGHRHDRNSRKESQKKRKEKYQTQGSCQPTRSVRATIPRSSGAIRFDARMEG